MSHKLIQNYEYIAAHIKDYIQEEKLFDVFELEGLKKILSLANFTSEDFITLLKQSESTLDENELYECARNTKVSIRNYQEVISTLKSVRKYMKLTILDGIIGFLDETDKIISESTVKIQKLQAELNSIQKAKQKSDNEIQFLKSELKEKETIMSQINEENSTDSNLLKEFKYPNQASKIIWNINTNNITESTKQIIELTKIQKIHVKMALYLIDTISTLRVKNIAEYAKFYQDISKEFSLIIKPENEDLATLLSYKGFNFKDFKPYKTEEDILNIYEIGSLLYFIAWDKIDDLKSEFPNLDANEKCHDLTPLECACKFGSELCFKYLKNQGAKYTENTAKFASKGGNKKIFSQMLNDGQSFNGLIDIALIHRNYELVNYLSTRFDQHPSSEIAKFLYYGNFDTASYLMQNGNSVNNKFILFLLISIIFL
ncbi:hypothetical protein TVAG_271400 [Trichomonas vaginalis G3]|uniref:DUF3447 domain-containing protein n=1 Tax=Trichomonas vaginalis (strain ATCC PRA-98 / G3) TaxID=412133 RepID=A2EAA9_TRIV3|nr:histone-lysine N-methyltransferase family [Trichomonas vaginalis G3]EAY10449.1 hypothetical protein TVAG_271400 [Trichomonas vaginalis G3]KAI5548353.1 histone-lysine N-methyltransferase family [Trichomonas vaginalis G3]|eukprot:XP_001322672.1 hypothetical protein [Trichomonas vaginalis G3]